MPGVQYAGLIHPGLIGCLPEAKMLARCNTREQTLIETGPASSLANPPFAGTAHIGRLTDDAKAKAAAEAACAVAPREHGGHFDIKDLSHGAKVFFPA